MTVMKEKVKEVESWEMDEKQCWEMDEKKK